MEKQMFITMEGGLIQDISVSADLEGVEVTLIDFDVDGVEETCDVRGYPATVDGYAVSPIADGDVEFFENLKKESQK